MSEVIDTHTIIAPTSNSTGTVSDSALVPTQSVNDDLRQRIADFETLSEALDYAAQGKTGINFHNSRGVLEHVLTYAELRDTAIQLGRQLLLMGLKRGDRIGLVAHMGAPFVELFCACQYAGLMAVPLPAVSGLGGRQGYEDQLHRILRKSEAKMAFGPEDVQTSLETASEDLNLLHIGTIEDVENIIDEPDMVLEPLSKDEPSHVQFSSGSTRHPLGVVISQKALMANSYSIANHGLKVKKGDRVASWLPFYHDMGLIGFMIVPVTTQMSIDYVYTDGFARRPLSWLDVISRNRSTLAFSPTFGYELCSRRAKRQSDLELDLSCWRAAGIGGEMVQPEIMREFSEIFAEHGFKPEAFVPSYGLAEATLAFSFTPLETGVLTDKVDRDALVDEQKATPPAADADEESVREFAQCGVPMPGYTLEIRDENGNTLPDRSVGSVFIKGPSLMDCYDKDDKATNAVLSPDREWLNTGDMGYTIDGSLVITGRAKDLIIVNGRNIWPQDLEWQVENEIEDLKARDTAAFSVNRNDQSEKAVMLIQCRSKDPNIQNKIAQDAQATIFRNAGIPCDIVMIPANSLPFTTSGKLSRNLARKNFQKGILRDLRDLPQAAE